MDKKGCLGETGQMVPSNEQTLLYMAKKNFDISFVYISPVGLDKNQFSLFNIIADFFWYMIGGATLLANLKLTR